MSHGRSAQRTQEAGVSAFQRLIVALAIGLIALAPRPVDAQLIPEAIDDPAWSFPVGERMEFAINLGRIRLGSATMTVEAKGEIDGTPVYRAALEVDIGAAVLNYEDRLVSWIEPGSLRSRVFERREGDDGKWVRRYEFDHESGRALVRTRSAETGEAEPGTTTIEGVPIDVLDEVAALYFLRTLSLRDGQTATMHRYFEPESDLLEVSRLSTDRIRVPEGRFDVAVLRPVIPAMSSFQRNRNPRMYVSEDARRLIVRVETDVGVGRLRMYLTDYRILDAEKRAD